MSAGPLIATLTGAGVGAVAGGLIGALTDVGVPEEEAGYYAEGVRRGGTLVTVRAEDYMVDRAVEIMERHDAVDVDQRASSWRESGWSNYTPQAQPYTAEEIARERDRYRTWSSDKEVSTTTPSTQVRDLPSASAKAGEGKEATIPVTEEQLRVGKRAVQQGVRVYSHVIEKPVEESVRLREEQVHVERRPVDRPVSGAGPARV